MSVRPHVAFVVQRCGETVAGGAEGLALKSARTMQNDWDCEILTTCARDAQTWSNVETAGVTEIAGIPTRRFPVSKPRDPRAFARASRKIVRDAGTRDEQEAWMRAQGPYAPELFAWLQTEGARYDCVFFFSYLYATTYFGLPHVARRSVLVPLAHEEWMLGLPLFDDVFEQAAAFGFVSEEERLLVERRFGNGGDGTLVRVDISAPKSTDPIGFRQRFGLTQPFGLYVGRVDVAKGVDDLVARFRRARERGLARDLVLAGPANLRIAPTPGLHVLGMVSEDDKWNAYAAADFAIVPSLYESLSITALEAWATHTPVLANGGSAVLIGQCRRSGAGLWYSSDDDFFALYESALLGQATSLGASGARYVAQTFTDETARASLHNAFDLVRTHR